MFMPEMPQLDIIPNEPAHGGEYQVHWYDYYVNEYFLAKALTYVLRYIDDDILYEIALDEASVKYKIDRKELHDLAVRIHATRKGLL